jgi:hypothetical protein
MQLLLQLAPAMLHVPQHVVTALSTLLLPNSAVAAAAGA